MLETYYLCMEIGGTNLRYGVVGGDFELKEFHKIPTAALSRAEDKGGCIESLLRPVLTRYGAENFRCLAMSLASLMDQERRVCYSSPNIEGFDHLPLAEILERRLGLPVHMERDVNTALLYEIWKRKLDSRGILVGIFIGTGLGNAMCIDGRIYTGHSGASCELGHIPLPGCGEVCGCGKKGCIELRAGGKALAKLAVEKYGCEIGSIFKLHGEETDVREVIELCALAAASEITILDPACVILGGGVVETEGFPMDYFEKTVRENLRIPNPRESLRLIKAAGDPEAGMVGAALHASGLGREQRKSLPARESV